MSNWMLQLCIVIVATSVCGAFAHRLGQGKVIGELLAGLLLGPSMLGAIGGAGYQALFSPASTSIVSHLGELGLVFLMFQTGAHIVGDMPRTRSASFAPFLIAALGMICPFAIGCAIAALADTAFAPRVPRLASILFCGIALSVSALPVMARIIEEAGIAHRASAKLSLLAATVTDAVGWIMLASVGAIATSGFSPSSMLHNLLLLAVFFAVSITVVRFAVHRLLDAVRRSGSSSALLICALCYLLLSSWVATTLGFHSAFGALIAAVNMSARRDLRQLWSRRFAGLAELVLTPLFFVSVGIQASISALHSPTLWGWLLLFLVGGVAGKFGGCYAAARLCRIEPEEARMVAALMNSRGTVELLVLSIGLQLHLIPASLYTVLLIATLAMTALSARWAHKWTREERRDVRHAVTAS
ncbi:cation:proton antiporter [Trinickia fusca]|uniref:Cation:proton antiporter n=1 Tax=Trinickia fusca TaxID=2419777 RepID=A0A494XBU9_9BURK|nr:cation:proton antiporter [Trinickia fusca]RKP45986.1 cation:proton antiporter [Trinickia fusca]